MHERAQVGMHATHARTRSLYRDSSTIKVAASRTLVSLPPHTRNTTH